MPKIEKEVVDDDIPYECDVDPLHVPEIKVEAIDIPINDLDWTSDSNHHDSGPPPLHVGRRLATKRQSGSGSSPPPLTYLGPTKWDSVPSTSSNYIPAKKEKRHHNDVSDSDSDQDPVAMVDIDVQNGTQTKIIMPVFDGEEISESESEEESSNIEVEPSEVSHTYEDSEVSEDSPEIISKPSSDDHIITLDMLSAATSTQNGRLLRKALNTQRKQLVGNFVVDPIGSPPRKQDSSDTDADSDYNYQSDSSSSSDDDKPLIHRRAHLIPTQPVVQKAVQLTNVVMCYRCPDPGIILNEEQKEKTKVNPNLVTSQCDKCSQIFYCKNHLEIHMSVHGFKFECLECSARFQNSYNADVHFRYKHCEGVKRFSCLMCGSSMSAMAIYEQERHFNKCIQNRSTRHKCGFVELV